MKFIVFFVALFGLGVPVLMFIQSMGSGNAGSSFDAENNQGVNYGCLGNLLGVFLVLVLFSVAAAISRFF